MTRKEKCTLVRLICKEIAETNHIVYLSAGCDQKCECSGACDKCAAEQQWLLKKLEHRAYYYSDITVAAQRLLCFGRGFEDPDCFDLDEFWYGTIENYCIDWESPDEFGEETDPLSYEIDVMNFSVRTFNALKRGGISTVKQLTQMTEEDLMAVDNITQRAIDEIVRKLNSIGLDIKRAE